MYVAGDGVDIPVDRYEHDYYVVISDHVVWDAVSLCHARCCVVI